MLARSLAPLREAGSTRTRDAHARLLDLAGAGAPASLAVERLWYGPRSTEALEVPIGVSDSGEVVTLALRRDGPHGLIAGTTGAGKSELLQSILAGLAVHNPPDVVSFLLVDYKGGAAFGDLATLPHTVGLVTDLDERLAARALVSLNAELRRREHILRQAGVADIAQFERQCRARAGGPTPQPLPNLVIVVDEFATIAQELPGFVDTLIDVAQRGRSLGVHLLLATQSPGGVVGPRLQANINYWMCLRVSLDAESTAMIGTNDAALIPVNAPGRAYLKVGSHLGAFQTARIACPVVSAGRGIVITPFADDRPPASGGPVLPQGHVADEVAGVPVETDLKVAVRRIAAEAIRLGVGRPPARGSRHCLRCCPGGRSPTSRRPASITSSPSSAWRTSPSSSARRHWPSICPATGRALSWAGSEPARPHSCGRWGSTSPAATARRRCTSTLSTPATVPWFPWGRCRTARTSSAPTTPTGPPGSSAACPASPTSGERAAAPGRGSFSWSTTTRRSPAPSTTARTPPPSSSPGCSGGDRRWASTSLWPRSSAAISRPPPSGCSYAGSFSGSRTGPTTTWRASPPGWRRPTRRRGVAS
ncbi:MAG TPA: FtsK/SpoIIIE domain-containing protein [Actinomycetota bacterium]|nr:FtsK/SpoIIIE domain-containing protein [Actinomycetota bacterium]